MKVIIPVVVLGFTAAAQANVYGPQAAGAIPDCIANNLTPGVLVSTIAVADAGSIGSVNSVTLTGLSHTWVGDLVVILTAPNGDNVHLMARTGSVVANGVGSGSDLAGTYVFVAGPTVPTFTAAAALTPVAPGTYGRQTIAVGASPPAADNDGYAVFAGDSVTGNWTLTVQDWFLADVGSLTSWSLDVTVGGAPCPANIVNSGTSANKVDVDDLLAVIGGWGPCPAPPAACPANIVNTGTSVNKVDVDDLLAVIGGWGPCPVK